MGLYVVEAGVIRTKGAGESMGRRLEIIHQGLIEVLDAYPASALALEQVHSHVEAPENGDLDGHVRGVIVLAAAQRGLTVFGYAAARIKKTLTGSGKAPKEQMQHAIKTELRPGAFARAARRRRRLRRGTLPFPDRPEQAGG